MLIHSRYRDRLERLCAAACMTGEQQALWLARYCDGAGIPELAANAQCHSNTIYNRLRAADALVDTLTVEHHPYEPGCQCYACCLRMARLVLDCMRNTGMSARRPERAPCGVPGADGRAWPLRGPLVTAEDMLAAERAVMRRFEGY